MNTIQEALEKGKDYEIEGVVTNLGEMGTMVSESERIRKRNQGDSA